MDTVTVLGGGISGLAVGYYLGRDKCLIYEADSHYGGHVYSEDRGWLCLGRRAARVLHEE